MTMTDKHNVNHNYDNDLMCLPCMPKRDGSLPPNQVVLHYHGIHHSYHLSIEDD